MNNYKVPLQNPRPDIENFIKVLRGDRTPEKPPMVEYLIDNAVMKPILEKMMGRRWINVSDYTEYMGGQMSFDHENRETVHAWLDNQIAFWYHMGYDFIRVEVSLPLPAVSHVIPDTANSEEAHTRAWQGMTEGIIKNWEDYEKYPWPTIKETDFYIHQYICNHLPDGFGFISCHAGGVYEHTSRLFGYEGLCFLLYDNPSLVKAVVDRLGELIERYNQHLLELERLVAIFQGEDFGSNKQTLISPNDIRKYFLPWHKKYAQMIHQKNKLYFMHSCGNIDVIMNDLINGVKIDGKHSFQDNVLPITEAKKIYGEKICLLGGVDIDKLARSELNVLRKYIRQIIEECNPGGRFAIGAGNSIPSFIPVENYLTLVDEALR